MAINNQKEKHFKSLKLLKIHFMTFILFGKFSLIFTMVEPHEIDLQAEMIYHKTMFFASESL